MLRSSHTVPSVMNGLCSWLDSSGYHFRIDGLNGTGTYAIQFNLRGKFSLYFKKQMKSVFEYFNVQNAEAEMTYNTVILKINV